jgi:hypothetical protein
VVKLMRVVSLLVKKIMVCPLHHHLLNQFVITEWGLLEVQYFDALLLERMNFMQIEVQNLWP